MSLPVFVLLGVLAPTVFLAVYDTQWAHPALLLHWLMIPILAVPLATLARTRRYLEISTYLFAYVFFGLASTAQLTIGSFTLNGNYSLGEVLWADALVLFGLVFFAIGAWLAPSRPFKWAMRELPGRRIWYAGQLSLFLFIATISVIGMDLALLFAARTDLSEHLATSVGGTDSLVKFQLALNLIRMPVMAASIMALGFWMQEGKLRWLAIGLVTFNVLINNPISTPRFVVGSWALAYFIILGTRFFPRKVGPAFAVLLPLLFAVVFPVLDVFRRSLRVDHIQTDVFQTFATKSDFDSFQLLMDAGRYVDARGLEYGKQILSSLLFFIPRAVWVGKGDPTGVILGEWAGRSNLNLAAPLWIEFFVDFWWIGTALGMATAGYFCRRLERSFGTPHMTIGSVLVPFLAGALLIILRGSLMVGMSFLMPILLFTLALSVRPKRWIGISVVPPGTPY